MNYFNFNCLNLFILIFNNTWIYQGVVCIFYIYFLHSFFRSLSLTMLCINMYKYKYKYTYNDYSHETFVTLMSLDVSYLQIHWMIFDCSVRD